MTRKMNNFTIFVAHKFPLILPLPISLPPHLPLTPPQLHSYYSALNGVFRLISWSATLYYGKQPISSVMISTG